MELTGDPAAVLAAGALVLPGVGAFRDGMQGLERLGLIGPIRQKAAAGTPLLGICLGMQMLFDQSEEFGSWQGLGLVPGKVVRIPAEAAAGARQKVPHIGWEGLLPAGGRADFAGTVLACEMEQIFGKEENIAFYTDFYLDALVCAIRRWLKQRDPMPAAQFCGLLKRGIVGVSGSVMEKLSQEGAVPPPPDGRPDPL